MSAVASSLATSRPLVIDQVFLFNMAALKARLEEARVRIGVATSVRAHEWAAAEIYPKHNPTVLVLTPEQRDDLARFASPISGR